MLAFSIFTPFPSILNRKFNVNSQVTTLNKFTSRRALIHASLQVTPKNPPTVESMAWEGLKLSFVEVEVDRAGCGPAELRDRIEIELKRQGDPVRWSIVGVSDANENVRVEGVVSTK